MVADGMTGAAAHGGRLRRRRGEAGTLRSEGARREQQRRSRRGQLCTAETHGCECVSARIAARSLCVLIDRARWHSSSAALRGQGAARRPRRAQEDDRQETDSDDGAGTQRAASGERPEHCAATVTAWRRWGTVVPPSRCCAVLVCEMRCPCVVIVHRGVATTALRTARTASSYGVFFAASARETANNCGQQLATAVGLEPISGVRGCMGDDCATREHADERGSEQRVAAKGIAHAAGKLRQLHRPVLSLLHSVSTQRPASLRMVCVFLWREERGGKSVWTGGRMDSSARVVRRPRGERARGSDSILKPELTPFAVHARGARKH